MGKKKDLTEQERYQIEVLLKEKYSIRQIAESLNRHYLTIYREIKKGTVELLDTELRPYKQYCADRGQMIADENKREKGRDPKIGNDLEFAKFMEKMLLEERYSPCAILAYIENNDLHFETQVCYTTVYNYIHNGIFLNVSDSNMIVKRKRKKNEKKSKVCKHNIKGRSIEKRPENIMERDEFGHWEMDTVIGRRDGGGDCLLVLTERKTRYELIRKIPAKSQESVVAELDSIESAIGLNNFRDIFKSISMDNGVEFLNMEGVERSITADGQLRTTAYYCHPYCSFERGSNENANKLIRRFCKKGEDIKQFTKEYISQVQDWINSYPRKLFGYRTAADMLYSEVAQI